MTNLVRKFEIKGEGRRFAALLFSLWLLLLAGYYFAASVASGGGSLPPPQPDTLLYCQSARRICEGHAFSFSAHTAVSTGTTSVLYPYVLAVPYALGFQEDALLTAGFFLNSVFLLIFLFGWGQAFRNWLNPKLALFATCLMALCPIVGYSSFAQSDTGIWMALSALFVWGLSSGNICLTGVSLVLGPWVRPEGIVLIIAYALSSCFYRERRRLLLLVLATVSSAGVFLLNWKLTGAFCFSSVASKGFFTQQPFPQALMNTAEQIIVMSRDLFFGQAKNIPRVLYSVPMLGSLALLIGLAVADWKRHGREWSILALVVVGSVILVAQSGWQGSNMDRYLAWIMPIFSLFAAIGCWWCYEKLERFPSARSILLIPVMYATFGTFALMVTYDVACDETLQMAKFARQLDRELPSTASIGMAKNSGLAYYLGDRRIANLGGIYSPEFAAKDFSSVFEVLKNEPQTRFDYWLYSCEDPVPKKIVDLSRHVELTGPRATQVRKVDWHPFDCTSALLSSVSNLTLKCRVDVGYPADEKRSSFETLEYYGMRAFEPLVEVAPYGDRKIVDCGRLILGEAEMDVDNLELGKDVVIVIRTIDKVVGRSIDQYGRIASANYSFSGPMGLHVCVDGRDVACCHAHVDKHGFSEISVSLSGRFITKTFHRIGLRGDHAAFCYWYYQ